MGCADKGTVGLGVMFAPTKLVRFACCLPRPRKRPAFAFGLHISPSLEINPRTGHPENPRSKSYRTTRAALGTYNVTSPMANPRPRVTPDHQGFSPLISPPLINSR